MNTNERTARGWHLLGFVLAAFALMLVMEVSEPVGAQGAPLQTCPNEMISYWKLDESSGAVYEDAVGDSNANCTAGAQCPAATTGRVNGAQQFDGSTTRLSVAPDPSFDWAASDSFSIELWVRGIAEATCTTDNEVMIGRRQRMGVRWWVGCEGPTKTAAFQLRNSTVSADNSVRVLTGGPALDDDQWHHIVAVRDGVNAINRLYVDGTQVDSVAHTYSAGFSSSTSGLTMGWYDTDAVSTLSGPPYYLFNGALDEVALYARVLSPEEIQQHYTAGQAGDPYCEVTSTGTPTPTATGSPPATVTPTATPEGTEPPVWLYLPVVIKEASPTSE